MFATVLTFRTPRNTEKQVVFGASWSKNSIDMPMSCGVIGMSIFPRLPKTTAFGNLGSPKPCFWGAERENAGKLTRIWQTYFG
jgi:hypothetical protein